MTRTDFRAAFIEELTRVAPDIDPDTVGDDDHIQDDLELELDGRSEPRRGAA